MVNLDGLLVILFSSPLALLPNSSLGGRQEVGAG